MSEEESMQAREAARLYSDDKTFSQISEELGISKSFAQTQVRRGIKLMEKEDKVPPAPALNNPGVHPDSGHPITPVELPPLPLPQDSRIGSYMVETDGISRRLTLTAMDIMIYDLFKAAGFSGDLSDFTSDTYKYMYDRIRPVERG